MGNRSGVLVKEDEAGSVVRPVSDADEAFLRNEWKPVSRLSDGRLVHPSQPSDTIDIDNDDDIDDVDNGDNNDGFERTEASGGGSKRRHGSTLTRLSIRLSVAATDFVAVIDRRYLSTFHLTLLCYGGVSGGTFGFETAIQNGGALPVIVALLVLPAIFCLPSALMTAELSSMFPGVSDCGGYIIWCERAFNPLAGFLIGFSKVVANCLDCGLYAGMFTTYLSLLINLCGASSALPDYALDIIRVTVVIIVALLNIRGIGAIGVAETILIVITVFPFIVCIFIGLPKLDPQSWTKVPSSWSNDPITCVSSMLSVIIWNMAGFDLVGACAKEVKDPGKQFPRAMIWTVIMTSLTYLLPLLVFVSVDSRFENYISGYFITLAQEIGSSLGGSGVWLAIIMAFAGLCSSLAQFTSVLCTLTRSIQGMGERRMIPLFFAKLHPTYGTPLTATLSTALIIIALTFQSFNILISIDSCFILFTFMLEFGALLYLRWSKPHLDRPYRAPLPLVGLIIFILPSLGLICFLFYNLGWLKTVIAAGMAGVAVILHLIGRRYCFHFGSSISENNVARVDRAISVENFYQATDEVQRLPTVLECDGENDTTSESRPLV